ncbi:glycerol-3-phosphate responsive antiterminator [Staphylococcus aureus]
MKRSIDLIKKVEPDFVEVFPGVASKAIHHIHKRRTNPIMVLLKPL